MMIQLSLGSAATLLLLSASAIWADTNYTDDALIRKLELYDVAAIKIIVNEGRTNLIPALERIADAPISAEEPSRIWARKALAKLGVKTYYDEIINDILAPTNSRSFREFLQREDGFGFALDVATKNAANAVRGKAMEALLYLQEPASVKIVAPMLYESPITKPGDPSPPQSAIYILARLNLPDAPPSKYPIIHARPQEIQAWQQWWKKHKDYYEKVEFGKPLPPRTAVPTSSPQLETNPISPPRPSQTTPGESATLSASWLYPLIISGVVLGGFVAWLIVRRRKNH